MKIALVSLKQGDGCIPIGLLYIATYLKTYGVPVDIVDANFTDPLVFLLKNDYDLIGISSMTVHYGRAIRLARAVKEKKNTHIVIGGVHISTLPESMEPCFDTAIIGEGEKAFLNLAKYGITKGIIQGEAIEDLDDLPQLDWELVDKRYFNYQPNMTFGEFGISGNILTSRGCPYKCRFCSTTQFWEKMRFHSADYVVESIRRLIKAKKTNLFQIWDDLFTIHLSRLEEIRNKLRLPKDVKFNCQPRPNLVTDSLCELLKSLNITIGIFGFESGSDRVLGFLKRNTVTVKDNMQAIEIFKKHGIGVQGSIVLGSPGETIEDMYKTLDFVDFCIRNKVQRLWAFILMPYPGTKMWEIAKHYKRVSDYDFDWDSLDCQNADNPLLLDNNVDRKEFKHVFNLIKKKVLGFRWGKVKSFLCNNPWESMELLCRTPKVALNLLTRKKDV